ncbi:MAG: hypothetical protein H0X26_09570 [Alphaproteobacteria bacterium]|nr:hypothetical protein [Alphaproteobacteria bacterium]
MTTKKHILLERKWQKICEDWQTSGLSVERYCEKQKIPSSSLYRWGKKLNFPVSLKPKKITYNWEELVKGWETSDLTPHAYCLLNGLTPSVFYRWERYFNSHKSRPTSHERAVKKWTKILEDWKESGLDAKSYCREKKIRDSSFYNWRKKLNFPVPIKPEKVSYNWEEVAKDWKASSLSLNKYCKEKKIPPSSFYKWREKVNHPAYITLKERADKWREIIKDWETSGLTSHAYCMLNDLCLSSFSKRERHLNPHKIRQTRHDKAVEKWTKVFEDWKESGLNKYTYCQRKGIESASFYSWVKKLNFPEPPQLHPDFTRLMPDICLEDHFTPISFGSSFLMESLPVDKKIEITLPQGHQLRIEGQFDWEGLNEWITLLLQPKADDEQRI